jgi:3-deoxy-D-manno-octulosonic-acid transferase
MWRYQLLLLLLAPVLLIYLSWIAIRHRDGRFLVQRLGVSRPRVNPGGLCIHAVSVGEVNAVAPLVRLIHTRNPALRITLTTSTPTGATTATRLLADTIQHAYLPVDWPWAMRQFLNTLQPDCMVIVETELWPNLYTKCYRRNTPLFIVNGRISPRTLKANPWLRGLYRKALQQTTRILARSDTDAARFEELGAPTDRLQVIGNLKLAWDKTEPADQPIALTRPYVLAASTHEDEEQQLAELWLTNNFNNSLLVIVPRHPIRLASILKQLQRLTPHIAVRSRNEPVTDTTRIYLADTFGELSGFMRGAQLVFMGGSLIPHGGQNIIEPARLGKAVLFGPHMHNFTDEAKLLVDNQAAAQVATTKELALEFQRLLADPASAAAMGDKARHLLIGQADMAQRYLDALVEYCPTLNR